MSLAEGLPQALTMRWSQESVVACFSKCFAEPLFAGFVFPMVEDLVNAAPFNTFSAREGGLWL